jgi:hypothetical protein
MEEQSDWLLKTIYQLKDFPRGTKILYPQNMGDIAVLPHGTQVLFPLKTGWPGILLVKRYPDGIDLFW